MRTGGGEPVFEDSGLGHFGRNVLSGCRKRWVSLSIVHTLNGSFANREVLLRQLKKKGCIRVDAGRRNCETKKEQSKAAKAHISNFIRHLMLNIDIFDASGQRSGPSAEIFQ